MWKSNGIVLYFAGHAEQFVADIFRWHSCKLLIQAILIKITGKISSSLYGRDLIIAWRVWLKINIMHREIAAFFFFQIRYHTADISLGLTALHCALSICFICWGSKCIFVRYSFFRKGGQIMWDRLVYSAESDTFLWLKIEQFCAWINYFLLCKNFC